MSASTTARQYRRRRVVAALLVVGVLLAVWAAVGAVRRLVTDDGPGAPGGAPAVTVEPTDDRDAADPSTRPTPSPSPAPPPDVRFTIAAAGDVLPHASVVRSAAAAAAGAGYDFGPLLAPLRPWVTGADLALCHLEVPIAPDGTEPSGYPAFGAPRELAAGLAEQGWDGCSTASNHALDRGAAGVVATLDALDEAGLGHVGTARTPAEGGAAQVYRLEREGRTVTVAHLAGTYAVNGGGPPADRPWSVTLLDEGELAARAAAARAEGADVVVVSVHCCVEYVTAPSTRQVEVATALAGSGAVDVVVGHHAHVPQPVELLPGGPAGAGMWVFHGLGNLLSNQDAACCLPGTASGVLATVEVVDPAHGPARVVAAGWTATTVDRAGGHRVHATPDIPDGTPTLPAGEVATRAAGVAAAVGPQAPPRTVPLEPTGPPPVVVPRPR